MDRSLWQLPFAIKTDLETAAKAADISLKARSDFLKVLLAEHEQPQARADLKERWTQWIGTRYPGEVSDPSLAGLGEAGGRAQTPPAEDGA